MSCYDVEPRPAVPALLSAACRAKGVQIPVAVGERTGPAIDNLDRAERFGWLAVEPWLGMRSLRNQMVHEYVEDMNLLHSALISGHAFVPQLVSTAQNMIDEVLRRGLCNKTDMA